MPIKVFIAYSHQDQKYLGEDSLLGYLKGLESDGETEFWYDEGITTGDLWNDEIKAKIKESQIAVLLISQAFLNSQYIKKVEIPEFLQQRKTDGMVLFPIILSPCEWDRYDWLGATKFLPKDGKTIETDFTTVGKRKKLWLEVLRDLRKQVGQNKTQRPAILPRREEEPRQKRERTKKVNRKTASRSQARYPETIAWENPFESVNADGLDYEDIPHLFVGEYTNFNIINKHFETLLEGQRGTGKTMVLRYIAFESQIREWTDKHRRKALDFFSTPGNFIGIYCRLEQGVFDKADLDAVDSESRKDRLFEHRLVLHCLASTLATLQTIFAYKPIQSANLQRLKTRLRLILNEPKLEDCQDWQESLAFANDTININVLEEDLHLGSLSDSTPTAFNPYLTLSGQFVPFLELLKEILDLKCPFFLLLDDFDVLRASQQMCVFRAASARKHNLICFKYGIMSLGKKAVLSGTGRTYREGSDYNRVSFDWTRKGWHNNYKRVCELITEARLDNKRWPKRPFNGFFDQWSHGEKLKDEIKKVMQREWQKLPSSKKPKTFSNYWTKYGHARFFQYLKEKKIPYRYAGYQDIIDVSSGIIRQYLEICKEIVSKALAERWAPRLKRPISPEIQNDEIRRYSQNMMHELSQTAGSTDALLSGDITITSKQMVTLIESLCDLFYYRLHSEVREPEVFTFSIRDTLDANQHAKLLLDVAVRESILHQRDDPYPPKTSGGPPLPTYMLNRRLIPRRDLSPRMQGRVEMLANDIVRAATEPESFKTKFLKSKKAVDIGQEPLKF